MTLYAKPRAQRPTICFLSHPEWTHHIPHTIITALELARMQDEFEVLALVSGKASYKLIERIAEGYDKTPLCIPWLPIPLRYRFRDFRGRRLPGDARMLKHWVPWINNAKCIVSVSHNDARKIRKLGVHKPKLVYQYHGVGDRAYGFDPELRNFDHVLLPGRNHRTRLEEDCGLHSNMTTIVGYPKLDLYQHIPPPEVISFPEQRPVVLYAPHWEPELSSWHRWGRTVLDFFLESKAYNLIFAPHLLLNQRQRIHGARSIDLGKYSRAPHILCDLGSDKSVDMTYIRSADIYLGDVSSQIYEWIAHKPRPAVFLNAHRVSWKADSSYRCWHYGPVVNATSELAAAFQRSYDLEWLNVQREALPSYIDVQSEPASIRAARAILDIARQDGLRPMHP